MRRRERNREREFQERAQARFEAVQYGLPWPGVDQWVAEVRPDIPRDTWRWS